MSGQGQRDNMEWLGPALIGLVVLGPFLLLGGLIYLIAKAVEEEKARRQQVAAEQRRQEAERRRQEEEARRQRRAREAAAQEAHRRGQDFVDQMARLRARENTALAELTRLLSLLERTRAQAAAEGAGDLAEGYLERARRLERGVEDQRISLGAGWGQWARLGLWLEVVEVARSREGERLPGQVSRLRQARGADAHAAARDLQGTLEWLARQNADALRAIAGEHPRRPPPEGVRVVAEVERELRRAMDREASGCRARLDRLQGMLRDLRYIQNGLEIGTMESLRQEQGAEGVMLRLEVSAEVLTAELRELARRRPSAASREERGQPQGASAESDRERRRRAEAARRAAQRRR